MVVWSPSPGAFHEYFLTSLWHATRLDIPFSGNNSAPDSSSTIPILALCLPHLLYFPLLVPILVLNCLSPLAPALGILHYPYSLGGLSPSVALCPATSICTNSQPPRSWRSSPYFQLSDPYFHFSTLHLISKTELTTFPAPAPSFPSFALLLIPHYQSHPSTLLTSISLQVPRMAQDVPHIQCFLCILMQKYCNNFWCGVLLAVSSNSQKSLYHNTR